MLGDSEHAVPAMADVNKFVAIIKEIDTGDFAAQFLCPHAKGYGIDFQ